MLVYLSHTVNTRLKNLSDLNTKFGKINTIYYVAGIDLCRKLNIDLRKL